MTTRQARQGVLSIAAFVLVTAVALGITSRGVGAQDEAVEAGHPAHIHAGTCDNLGDVVRPLNDVGGGMMDGTPIAMGEMMGAASAIPVEVSVTTVNLPLADIVSGGHAINVHESGENIGTYIACGDIGGRMMGSDLAIGLGELNDSGELGTAWLHDNGDGSTTVYVFLLQAGGEGEAAAEDGGADAATGEQAVAIVNFAYDPPALTIPVGTTVTWTNQDAQPHTATGTGGAFQSGRLDQGQSFSYTFAEAGTFEYFCEFHPNMKATITVE